MCSQSGHVTPGHHHLDRAKEALLKALKIDPTCALAIDSLGQVLLDTGEYKNAIETCLEPLISLFPRAEAYYYKMAVALTDFRGPEAAAQYLELAISKGLMLPRLFYDLAWTAARASTKYKGRKKNEWEQKALAALQQATKLDTSLLVRAQWDQDFDGLKT